MARMTAEQRRQLAKNHPDRFGVPGKAPGPGSYPMGSEKQALAAERLAGFHPADKAKIDAKAHKLYPQLGHSERGESPAEERRESPAVERREQMSGMERAMGAHADRLHPVKR